MKVVLAPDKFKGSLTAPEVAAALAAGIADAAPDWCVVQAPVADGGEGTVDAALAAGWSPVTVDATGPVGDPLTVTYARSGDRAVVELAATSGLAVLPGGVARPLDAGTVGLGSVLAHALDGGAREIVVGLGGSASTDGGAGLLVGLGARVLDEDGAELPSGGAALARAAALDLSGLHPGARQARFVFACDVDNPLLGPTGAAAVYGPQKGASPAQVAELDAALGRWAALLQAETGRNVADEPGAGAAGGASCGAAALLDVTRRSGVELILELIGFADLVAGADLVVTGEGKLDHQSLHGKAPTGVAAAAGGARVVAVAGASTLSAEQLAAAGFAGVHTVVELAPDVDTAMRDAATYLRRIGATLTKENS